MFNLTDRPNDTVFYNRNDANDPRFGERVWRDPADYDAAEVVLLGLPQDEGVRRNKGRVGAAEAPDAIRTQLYKLVPPEMGLFDLGNTQLDGELEDIHARHREVVRQVIADGKKLIVLGGGNDTSYPDCAGLTDVVSDCAALNIDAHYDVRADAVPNSGTPYRQLLEGGHLAPEHFYEVANHPFANSATYTAYLDEQGAHIHPFAELRRQGTEAAFHRIVASINTHAIFWGIDMDSVRASDAPGVSAPNPIGLSADDLLMIATLAGHDTRTKLFEITELNPTYDIDGRTARLAALTVWHFLHALV